MAGHAPEAPSPTAPASPSPGQLATERVNQRGRGGGEDTRERDADKRWERGEEGRWDEAIKQGVKGIDREVREATAATSCMEECAGTFESTLLLVLMSWHW